MIIIERGGRHLLVRHLPLRAAGARAQQIGLYYYYYYLLICLLLLLLLIIVIAVVTFITDCYRVAGARAQQIGLGPTRACCMHACMHAWIRPRVAHTLTR